ncbi:hypothetical protein Q760_04030 [Cellulomonas cellasea DSM 20118]|uniref:VWA7 N-terminal domain-containing protein n=2 Tax=Cellulomonas cellasea TaxID=43670 RepID=A0A0A0B978_9CELL|nr:hypothetical protein Q760_04030 [Cellulomonas cellasea DSM 20118]
MVGSTLLFGGEDPAAGDPWYHEEISRGAALDAGFGLTAADDVAWHTDYVDSYLYNPYWWATGGIPRLKASLAGKPLLKNLHFDDLFAPGQVLTMWRRYTSGTLAGLAWAWRADDVGAARNVVGAGLHALQDFYSHSNWVDDETRRTRTFLEVPVAERAAMPLWTGSYELPDHLGLKPHGKPAPWCGALSSISGVMDIVCHPASPLSDGPVCRAYRACRDSAEARPEHILGVPIPAGVYYLAPPGIALDSTWQAEIGVQVRGLTDISGKDLFKAATDLARSTSSQWLELLGARMTSLGAGEFWDQVRTATLPAADRERQFEEFHRFPYGFAAVGPYPPPVNEQADEWYLRVRLVTGRDPGAGTDSDIVVHAGGRSDVLDYMPRDHPLLAYNDFESGDDQAYYLGPYSSLPPFLEIENRSASVGDVFVALGTSFVRAVQSAVESVAAFLFNLIGGPADLVGNTKMVWTPARLAALADNVTTAFTLQIDGRAEGRYRVYGDIRRERRTVQAGRPWSDYVVRLNSLFCVKESEWDRGTSGDEPFLLALLVNQAPGQVHRMRTGAFNDVDTGESRTIGHTFPTVRVPDEYGYLTLPVQVLESDDESAADRDRALAEFADGIAVGAAQERERFITTLGRAVAADWQLARAEVFAFTRGTTVTAGTAYDRTLDRWVRGGQRVRLDLQLTNPVQVDVGLAVTGPQVTTIDVAALASQARWVGAELTDTLGNTRNEQVLPFDGSDGDARGFVRLGPLALEDGRTTTSLWTHPMWVANGTIKGWHPDTRLPAHARFEALVGFRSGAFFTDGARFMVFEHHSLPGGGRVWNPVVDVHKGYTGSLLQIAADLSHLAGKDVGIELRVDAGPSSAQDWAVWVDPRVVGT